MIGVALLLVLAPILAVVAICVRASLGRPVLYRQTRVGRHGESFDMLKFRTMQPDRRLEQQPLDGSDRRHSHKTPQDPRHTRLGRVLREYSLDELPQLWNVMRGDLSIVGPRPELTAIVDRYQPWQHARHAVKPGVTGLWQVTERGNGRLMHEHTDIDLDYVNSLSWRTDLRIMLLTLPAILGSHKGM